LTRPGIAVDENDLYWADFGSIGRANLDGSNVNQNFIPVVAGPNMIGRHLGGADVLRGAGGTDGCRGGGGSDSERRC
jgi:hypothetical protein